MTYKITMNHDDLKKWRMDNGYSQSQLAKALSVHVMTISQWERGIRKIPPFLYLALKWLESEGGDSKRKGTKKERRSL